MAAAPEHKPQKSMTAAPEPKHWHIQVQPVAGLHSSIQLLYLNQPVAGLPNRVRLLYLDQPVAGLPSSVRLL
jgi:hypothetical protein